MNNKQFLWGASTSAFQAEGAYLEDGKGLATVDIRNVPAGIADTKIASDHYHHWEEDIQAMKELGLNVYRLSFSWSRIMPDGWHVNEKGLAFYEKIIDRCLEYGISHSLHYTRTGSLAACPLHSRHTGKRLAFAAPP